MLDVRRMQVLRAVVTSGSVTAAASHLGYTPSAVSQQIATLEKEAGVPLLERVGRGVRPTPAGLLLNEHAAVLGRDLAEAERALAELRAGRTGRLAVRYFTTAGLPLVAPAVSRLRREHPGVRTDLTLRDPLVALEEVAAGDADLALVVGPGASTTAHAPAHSTAHAPARATEATGVAARRSPPDAATRGPGRHFGITAPEGVRLVPLLDDPYDAVVPAGHRLARTDGTGAPAPVALAEFAGEDWVGCEPPGPCLDPLLRATAAAGFTPAFVVECEDYAGAQGFVAAGMGVALMPRLGIGVPHPGVRVLQVDRPQPVRSLYAAVREASLHQPAARCLLDALQEAARKPRSEQDGRETV